MASLRKCVQMLQHVWCQTFQLTHAHTLIWWWSAAMCGSNLAAQYKCAHSHMMAYTHFFLISLTTRPKKEIAPRNARRPIFAPAWTQCNRCVSTAGSQTSKQQCIFKNCKKNTEREHTHTRKHTQTYSIPASILKQCQNGWTFPAMASFSFQSKHETASKF